MSDSDAMLDAYHAARLDYSPRDGVDTEPGSLEHFADLMDGDHKEFQATRAAVEHVHFADLIQTYVFAGGEAGGLPEAADFARAYSELEIGMRIMMMQIEGGLSALQLGASFIHMAYELSDLFGAEQVSNPFAAYDGDAVREVFRGGNIGVAEIAGDGGTVDAGGEEVQILEDEWESQVENERQIEDWRNTDLAGATDGEASVNPAPEVWAHDRFQHAGSFQDSDGNIQLTLPDPRGYPAESEPHPLDREDES